MAKIRLSEILTFSMQPVAWFCIVALLIASWTPGQEMVRTGFDGRLEHVAAYLVATSAVSLAYPWLHRLRLAVIIISYAAALELGQLLVPGRHAGLLDWIASSIGVVIAVLIMKLLDRTGWIGGHTDG